MQPRDESPLRLAHWLGGFDTRPLALFRIALGTALLQDLMDRAGQIGAFLADGAAVPHDPQLAAASWSLFNPLGSPTAAAVLFAVGVLATLAFTVGFHTRVATVVAWFFFVSLHHRVPVIQTGGDSVADCLLFFSCFTNLSGRWSFDARRRGDLAEVHALVPRLMQYVPALLYMETVYSKLGTSGRQWFNGPILFQHMHLYGWVRPLGVWLGEHPQLCALMTGATIVTEILIPVLFAMPVRVAQARALATLCHLGLQIGILLTLKVGIFTNVMLACTALWLLPAWLDRAGSRLARRGTVATWRPTPLSAAALGIVVGLYGLMALDQVVPRHLPSFSRPLVTWLGLDLKIGLFTHGYPSMRWAATGRLADGSTTDPLRAVAPASEVPTAFRNTLWMQLPYRLEQYDALGRYVCAQFNAGPGAARPLEQWTLDLYTRDAYAPESPIPPETRRTVLTQECGARTVAGGGGPTPR
jgi:hypothetical protein